MIRFVLAIFLIGWLGTAILSKKRMEALEKKDGHFVVVFVKTLFVFLVSMVLVLFAVFFVKHNGTKAAYDILDAATAFFYIMLAATVIEFIVMLLFGKKLKG